MVENNCQYWKLITRMESWVPIVEDYYQQWKVGTKAKDDYQFWWLSSTVFENWKIISSGPPFDSWSKDAFTLKASKHDLIGILVWTFSILADFQRREKVLEDLAIFKSSAMMWFFCMRDWREAASKYAQNYFLLKVMDVYEHINAVLDFLNTRWFFFKFCMKLSPPLIPPHLSHSCWLANHQIFRAYFMAQKIY